MKKGYKEGSYQLGTKNGQMKEKGKKVSQKTKERKKG